ncbi:MAG: hypothetical protein M0Q54_10160 [Pigmentiphaga sp.]|nr:hypothetical protein [Pigmentiphaga sp.]
MIQGLGRYGMVLGVGVLLAACSVTETITEAVSTSLEENRCQRDPRSCIYEGKYEPGEREFAEQEARRLNQAEGERLRRVLGRS